MKLDQIRALLVEDNVADARILLEAVKDAGAASAIQLVHAQTLSQAIEWLAVEKFDVVLLDLHLPDEFGLATLTRAHAAAPAIPIIVLTGLDDEALAAKSMREGAQDYLVKGNIDGHLLLRAVRYATERKHAIESLQRREEHFRLLIENALDLITILNSDGTIRYVSPSQERLLGYAAEDLIGVNALSLIHPQDVPEVIDAFRANQNGKAIECRFQHKNGTWRVLEAFGRNLLQIPGVQGIVVNARDVTERRNVEEALREANHTLRAVFQTSPLAIYSTDSHGAVKSWNAAAQSMFGWSERELMDRQLPQFQAEAAEVLRMRREQALREIKDFPLEAICRRKDGSNLHVRVWIAELRDAYSNVTGYVDVVSDITDRKRLEEQLQHSQRLDAIGRLAGGIAHDFNNMLMIISGYAQMLHESVGSGAAAQADLQQIVSAAERGAELTRQLLAFSRKQVVSPKVVDLNVVVRDMQRMLQRVIGEHITLFTELDPALPCVYIDAAQIEQVLVNLAVNARDAMGQGGTLTIRTDLIEVDDAHVRKFVSPPEGQYIRLSVSDTGVGIPPEAEKHLFEPFYTTKDKGKGTGLGLSTSYGVIKQNEGEFLFEPTPGGGATFHILLPPAGNQPQTVEPVRKAGASRGSGTILLVEDDNAVRQVVESMLHRSGYSVLTCARPGEALTVLDTNTPAIDLLITDVVMPGMSGPELAERATKRRPNLPVLFVSGYADSLGKEVPGPYLQKPFTHDMLTSKIKEALHPADVN